MTTKSDGSRWRYAETLATPKNAMGNRRDYHPIIQRAGAIATMSDLGKYAATAITAAVKSQSHEHHNQRCVDVVDVEEQTRKRLYSTITRALPVLCKRQPTYRQNGRALYNV